MSFGFGVVGEGRSKKEGHVVKRPGFSILEKKRRRIGYICFCYLPFFSYEIMYIRVSIINDTAIDAHCTLHTWSNFVTFVHSYRYIPK